MREILFRGKRIDNGKWIEGHYGEYMLMSGESIPCVSIPNKEAVCGSTCYDVEASTVGQFTGLTDKNGKKVFEGDIVHFRTSGLSGYGEVKEDNGRFVIVDKRKKPTRYYPFYDDAIYRIDGNIHDNFELLGGDIK